MSDTCRFPYLTPAKRPDQTNRKQLVSAFVAFLVFDRDNPLEVYSRPTLDAELSGHMRHTTW